MLYLTSHVINPNFPMKSVAQVFSFTDSPRFILELYSVLMLVRATWMLHNCPMWFDRQEQTNKIKSDLFLNSKKPEHDILFGLYLSGYSTNLHNSRCFVIPWHGSIFQNCFIIYFIFDAHDSFHDSCIVQTHMLPPGGRCQAHGLGAYPAHFRSI